MFFSALFAGMEKEAVTHFREKYLPGLINKMEGFINSTPVHKGGYVLAKPANKTNINKLLKAKRSICITTGLFR